MILVLTGSIWLVTVLVTGFTVVQSARGASLRVKLQCLTRNQGIRELAAVGGLGAATALFFWRLLAGQVWMPAGGGDLAQFLYPTYSFAAEWWRQGVIPLWNPHLFAGAPFIGDSQSGIFYPLNLLAFALAAPLTFRDMEYLAVLHFVIAGTGMYALLRFGRWQMPDTDAKDLSMPAALAGAITFEFSDLFITHFGNLNLIAVAAWMPLILLFYRRAVTDKSVLLTVMSGIALAVAFFAGHPQVFLFVLVTLVLFGVFHTIERGRAPVDLKHHPFFLLTVTGLVALGLSAPVLLPSLEMALHTVRTTFTYEQAARFSLAPGALIGLFVPGFFGRGPSAFWGPWDRVEVGYVGILPLLLAMLAVLLRRDRHVRFMGALVLIGLVLALGGYAIVHGWLYQFMPGFGQLRAPARFIFLLDFALAMLAAFGFDALVRRFEPSREVVLQRLARSAPWVFLIIAVVTSGVAYTILILGQGQDPVLFQRMTNSVNAIAFFVLVLALSLGLLVARVSRFFRVTTWQVLALALIFFDLFSLGAYVDTSGEDPTRVYDHPDAVAFLKSNGGLFRVDPRETGVENVWPADASLMYGLWDVTGDNPLVLADFDRYWQALGSRSSPLYDLLNVRYLIGRKNVPLDWSKFRLVFDGDPGLGIFENTHVRPRAWLAFTKQIVASQTAAMSAIHAEGFDSTRTVVLEKDAGPAVSDPIAVGPQPEAKVTGYGPNEILLETNAATNGVLFLSEVYYPGWRAWVDGNEVEVLRADYVFRAIGLPAGSHHVRFLYDPLSFRVGELIFVVTGLALLGWLPVQEWIRRRKRPT